MSLHLNSRFPTPDSQFGDAWELLEVGSLRGARRRSCPPAFRQDMPDPSLIHGRAIPAPELANGTVTVRVVREAIGNNAPGQQVSVTVGGASDRPRPTRKGAPIHRPPVGWNERHRRSDGGRREASCRSRSRCRHRVGFA